MIIEDQMMPEVSDYLFYKAGMQNIPLSGTFELTARCNMNCKMCYVRLSQKEVNQRGREKTTKEWLDMAWQCREAGMLYLLLTGGEPFVYPNFWELYHELKQMGFLLSMNTNGTLLDDKAIDRLIQEPPNRMNITLYGASGETYGRLCGYEGGFDRVTHAIEELKKAGVTLKLNASMTPYNIADMEKMYAFAEKVGIFLQAASYMFPAARKTEENVGKGERFTPKEAAKEYYHIEKIRLTEEDFEKKIHDICEADNLKEIPVEKGRYDCRAGSSTFWITWDGRMTPCGMLNFPEVSPFRDGFAAAWKELYEKMAQLRYPQACKTCDKRHLCTACAACVYTETGNFEEKPEYLCEMTKYLIDYAKQYKK